MINKGRHYSFVKSNYNVDNINKEMFINSLCYLKSDE